MTLLKTCFVVAALLAAPVVARAQLFGPGFDITDPFKHSPFDPSPHGPYGPHSPRRPGPATSVFGDPSPSATITFYNQWQNTVGFMVNGQQYTMQPFQGGGFQVPVYAGNQFNLAFMNGHGIQRQQTFFGPGWSVWFNDDGQGGVEAKWNRQ